MRRLGWGLLGMIGGYSGGLVLGIVLIGLFSGNTHDKGAEVATTAALITGPIGAVIGLVAALMGGSGR